MRQKVKKLPSDYPQFAFRCSQEDKERIMKLVKKVQDKANRGRSKNEFKALKNDLLVEALLKGLSEIGK